MPHLRRYYPYLAVCLAPLILFAPFVVGAQMFYWGTPLLQFYPWRHVALETIRKGYLPLWNPLLGNGAPLIANYQSAVFYPPNWLSLAPGLPLDLSLNWLMVLHVIWAGVGMVTLARWLGYRPLGQAVAGLAFGMGQYLVARSGFYSINAVAAWVPWIIWAADQCLHSNPFSLASGAFHVLRLSTLLALQLLAGHAQITWYTWLLLGGWVLWRSLTTRPRPMLAAYPSLALALVLAGLIAALQLLPTAELLRQSPRADAAEYEFVMTYSFSPWRLLTLIAPDILGNPARGRFYGYGNYVEDAVYAGVLTLMLGLSTISGQRSAVSGQLSAISGQRPAASRQPPIASRLPFFLVLLLLVALVLALGRNTPVFPLLYQHVPTFNLFQAPTRMMVWFAFALALLGGWGGDRWNAPQGRALYWTRLGAAGAVAVIVTSGAALFALPPTTAINQQVLTVARAVMVAGLHLLIAAALSLTKPAQPSLRWELLVVLALAGDLIYANAGLNPGAARDLYRAPTETGRALAGALNGQRLFIFPDDEYALIYDRYFSFLTYGEPEAMARAAREAQLPNITVIDGLASAGNFDPLKSARYVGFIDVISRTRSLGLLNLMNVSVLASREPLPWEVIARNASAPDDLPIFYRVPGRSQRVWLVPEAGARVVPNGEAARAAIAEATFDPATVVILEADDAGLLADGPLRSPASPADPNTFSISLNQNEANWVVISDTWYPGWVAYVDGQPTPLRRADYAFRAVHVPAGAHQVEFRYAPRSFQLGLLFTGVGLVLWLALAAGLALQRR